MHGQVKTNQQLDERLNFLGLGQEQRQNLSDMKGVITGSLDASLDRFYAKARSVPETAKFFA
ncbi:MAG: protoglobin domain-containing protein, partial [Agrobacterium tumefaciens]